MIANETRASSQPSHLFEQCLSAVGHVRANTGWFWRATGKSTSLCYGALLTHTPCGPSRASGRAPEPARATAFCWWARLVGRRLGQCSIRGHRLALRAAACSVGAGSLRGWQLALRAPTRSGGGSSLRGCRIALGAAASSVGAGPLRGRKLSQWAPTCSAGGSSLRQSETCDFERRSVCDIRGGRRGKRRDQKDTSWAPAKQDLSLARTPMRPTQVPPRSRGLDDEADCQRGDPRTHWLPPTDSCFAKRVHTGPGAKCRAGHSTLTDVTHDATFASQWLARTSLSATKCLGPAAGRVGLRRQVRASAVGGRA